MCSFLPNSSLNKNSNFDEDRWIVQIRRALDGELEDDDEVPVSIFSVPKSLLHNHPDSYTPQQVALGPYHHWRPELYEMERYKLSAAKRTQRQLQCPSLQELVEHLTKLETRIRACYYKYLDFNGETLAWMMAIDSCFMLEFLSIYSIKKNKVLSRVSSRMSHLVDYAGRKSAHNAILRDMVMLENQIPLFVLGKILEFQCSTLQEADDMLLSALIGFCKEASPFKMIENLPKIQVSECAHLLEFLYNLVLSKLEFQSPEINEGEEDIETTQGTDRTPWNSSYVKKFLEQIKMILSFFIRVLQSRELKVILKYPWTIISNLPGFSILKQPIEHLFFTQDRGELRSENESFNTSNPPLVEEITIPSVVELSKAGVRFIPTDGSISTISFEVETFTLSLPTISLDVNTEVVLRNLVAYEAANASGPLVFTRYTELMNGIIDTKEDVKLLREKGIVLNRLKSDEEAANLWNGMSKSIRLTKVPSLDKVIEDVDRYYNGKWKVKLGKFYKDYMIDSWRLLVVLCALFLLLLMSLQAFCSVYGFAHPIQVRGM